jgi:DNA-binding beta-propeller fold protein YncE
MLFSSVAPGSCSVALIALMAGCSGVTNPPGAPLAGGNESGLRSAERELGHPELAARIGALGHPSGNVPRVEANKAFSGVLWVSDLGTNSVYKCTPKRCEVESTGFSEPQGMAAPKKGGNVYVADTANSRVVELDKNGNQIAVLADPGYYPVGVGVALDGTVGVANICDVKSCSQGNIEFYAPGATSPTSTANGVFARYYFGGFDAAGNFYNDGTDGSGIAHVGIVAAGSTTDVDTGIAGIGFPGGVQVAQQKKGLEVLDVDDQSCPCIDQYSLPSLTFLGSIQFGGVDPVTFALNKSDNDMWVADAGQESLEEFAYPAGGDPIYSLPGLSLPVGVVAVPPGED